MELVSGIKGGFVDFEILVFGEGKRTRRLQGLTPNCLEFALKVMHRSWGQAVAYYYICIYLYIYLVSGSIMSRFGGQGMRFR